MSQFLHADYKNNAIEIPQVSSENSQTRNAGNQHLSSLILQCLFIVFSKYESHFLNHIYFVCANSFNVNKSKLLLFATEFRFKLPYTRLLGTYFME